MAVIEAAGLTKYYGRRIGCKDITFEVEEGRVFALLGPNGAGKSTIVKCLVGLLHPTSGQARILGVSVRSRQARAQLGFLPEQFQYHYWLTAAEVLALHASLYGLKTKGTGRIAELLEQVGLSGAANQRVGTFSKGMQQRLGLACALVSRPRLVFLDEPTSALDPVGRKHVREIIAQLKQQGVTVFLNSHLLSEVELLCDQVVFINKGHIIAQGDLKSLLSWRLEVDLRVGSWPEGLKEALMEFGPLEINGDRVQLHVSREKDIPRIARTVVESGADLLAMSPRRRSLEEMFIELVEEDN